jgi:hypothetical protein
MAPGQLSRVQTIQNPCYVHPAIPKTSPDSQIRSKSSRIHGRRRPGPTVSCLPSHAVLHPYTPSARTTPGKRLRNSPPRVKFKTIRFSWQPQAGAFPQLTFVCRDDLIQHGGRHHVSGITFPSGQGTLSDILVAQVPSNYTVSMAQSRLNPQSSPWSGTSGTTYGKSAVSEARTGFYEVLRKESVDFDKHRESHDTKYNLILLVVRPLINAASFLRVWLIPDPRPLSARQTSPSLSNMTKTHCLRNPHR